MDAAPAVPSGVLTTDELAEALRVHPATIRRWRRHGRLPDPVQIGGAVRWRTRDIREWIDAGCPASGGGAR